MLRGKEIRFAKEVSPGTLGGRGGHLFLSYFLPFREKKIKAGKMSCLLKGECIFTEAHKPWVALNVVALRYTIGLLCFKGFGHPSRPTPPSAVHSSKHGLSHYIQMLDDHVHFSDTTFWLVCLKGKHSQERSLCVPQRVYLSKCPIQLPQVQKNRLCSPLPRVHFYATSIDYR